MSDVANPGEGTHSPHPPGRAVIPADPAGRLLLAVFRYQ